MIFLRFKPLFFVIATIVLSLAATSCSPDEPAFTISGVIKNADGKILYLSKVGIERNIVIDSFKLDEDGEFKFSQPALKHFEFYTLSLTNKGSITLAVDSTDNICVNADANDLFGSYSVSGSEESEHIKEMGKRVKATEKQIAEMIENTPPETAFTQERIDSLVDVLKMEIADKYVLNSPDRASAYFALHLLVGSKPLFNPTKERFDSKCFATVATRMQKNQPNSARTKQITATAEKGMRLTREITEKDIEMLEEKISTKASFNISLPDRDDKIRELSSLTGKVVLLDFTLYNSPYAAQRTSKLDDLYLKYHKKGFEIYQISYDVQPHFWKTEAKKYPWVCVHDRMGSMSDNLRLYNIQAIPTYFLLNKENEPVLRDVQIDDIEKEIEKLLKE